MSTSSGHRLGGVAGRIGDRRGGEGYLGRVFLGLVLLGLGVVALLDSAGALNGDRAIDRWWPLILILAGVLRLLEGRRSTSVSLGFVGVGGLLLLFTTNTLSGDAGDYVGPALLLAAALVVLAHARVGSIPAGGEEGSSVRIDGILGRPHVISDSHAFRGGFLTAFLGHATLDLRPATPAPQGATISATATLGGIDILVPTGWRVVVKGTPLLGGIHDRTDHSVPSPEDAPALHVDALALLGDVEVKHRR